MVQNKNEVIHKIEAALSKLEYGQIVISIHNSKVVQIDITEKNRFDISNIAEDQK